MKVVAAALDHTVGPSGTTSWVFSPGVIGWSWSSARNGRTGIAIVERAIERGELPKGTDADLIVDLVSAPVQSALLFNERVDASYVDRILDVVLAGAGAARAGR